MLAALESFDQRCVTACKGRVVQLDLTIIEGARCINPWSGEHQHPANIGGQDKMPGWAHQMSAQNAAIGECLLYYIIASLLHPHPKRPFCAREILSLDSAQPL